MESFYNKTKKAENAAVLIFTLLFITVGFLQLCSLTYGRFIISVIQWPTVILGMILVIYRLINLKHFIKTRGIVFLIVFALGYAASSVLTLKYGYYNNIRTLSFMVMQIALLYATDSKSDPEFNRKRLIISANYVVIGTAFLSALSFVFMFTGYSKEFLPEVSGVGPAYYIGFVNGRLFGAYWDPNIAATLAAVVIVVSVFFFISAKKTVLKVLYILNAVLQILYISFSGSRTGHLCIIAAGTLISFILACKHKFSPKKAVQTIAVLLTVIISVSAIIIIPKMVQKLSTDVAVIVLGGENKNMFDRGYDMSTDVSNRRFEIWGASVDVFKSSPILGTSRANILNYVDEYLPDSYLVRNDHMRFDSMHNMWLEILASQGIVGIVAFVGFTVWVLIGIFKNFLYLWNSKDFYLFALIFCIAATVCASTLVMTEIVYVISPTSTLFWLSIGTINHYIENKNDKQV